MCPMVILKLRLITVRYWIALSRGCILSHSEIFEVSGENSNHSRSGGGLNRLAGEHALWVGLRTLRCQCILSAR